MGIRLRGALAGVALAFLAPGASAGEPIEEVVIVASRAQARPLTDTSSEGVVLGVDLEDRPLLRPGEVLEAVPGLIVTQHSGEGKANQYFLRGFNLDHGTDFATSIEGLPMNLPTHAHGQGYTDLNGLIPELIERIDYRKGPYFAEEGDFSAAGAAAIRYVRRLATDFASATVGEHGYQRGVLALVGELAGGDLLVGIEAAHDDGPWVTPEGFRAASALIKFSRGDATAGFSLEAMGYDGRWRSTDQIPERAVEAGLISRFGALDPSDGGASHRYSLSADRWLDVGGGALTGTVYVIDYRLDLFSDFTYFRDPVHGDQIEQFDERRVGGGRLEWRRSLAWAGRDLDLQAGVQAREDHIAPVALYDTTDRIRWRTVSESRVEEASVAAFLAASVKLAPRSRLDLGLRADTFDFRVAADRLANSGDGRASMVSPKASVVLGPWADSEFFLSAGRGFHSNDARGATTTVEATDGTTKVARVTPLARAFGAETGVRTSAIPGVALTATAWTLALDSELTLDNDASAIEPSGATRRYGLELAATYRPPVGGVTLDANLAVTHARYTGHPPEGQYLPNSLQRIASVELAFDRGAAWFGAARLRYVGAAPITQADSIRSRSSLQVSADVGYRLGPSWDATLAVFNLLNRRSDDIEYYYASQLRGETAPTSDIHFHPGEPISVRAGIRYRF